MKNKWVESLAAQISMYRHYLKGAMIGILFFVYSAKRHTGGCVNKGNERPEAACREHRDMRGEKGRPSRDHHRNGGPARPLAPGPHPGVHRLRRVLAVPARSAGSAVKPMSDKPKPKRNEK